MKLEASDHNRKNPRGDIALKRLLFFFVATTLAANPGLVAQEVIAKKQPSEALASAGFDIYHVARSDGSTIQCYLSGSSKTLPLIVNFEGSGAGSAFRQNDGRVNGGMTGYLASVASETAHVLVLEKPGVKLFDEHQKGTVKGASRTFLENYTLEYLTQSHIEAIRAIVRLPQVSGDRILLFGISDGGQLAAETSAKLPEATHVAALACGGPTQIFDFVQFADQPQPDDEPGDVQKRVEEVYTQWEAIQQDPLSIEKFWNGHPYRRWASLCAASTTDALMTTKAKIFVAQGTADDAVPVESFDVLVSTLRTKGKTIVAERLDGLNHNFENEKDTGEQRYVHLDQLIERILNWWT